jgi:hypothetical protein
MRENIHQKSNMKSVIIVFAICFTAASAQLVVPNIPEFRDGLFVVVEKVQQNGQEYPSFNVTVYNPTENDVKKAYLVRDILLPHKVEDMGMLQVDADEKYFPKITSAYEDLVIDVPAMSTKVYTFTKKVFSGYN